MIRSNSATRLFVIMIFLGFLIACLTAVNAEVRPIDPRFDRTVRPEWNNNRPPNPPNKGHTVIENKNVNIIVNVDPKDVARELWNLIQNHVDGRQGRRSDVTRATIDELEKIVTPIVMPSRRSSKPSAFELAHALDEVTRKVIIGDNSKKPTIEDEIATRDVVSRMMLKLKTITESDEKPDVKEYRSTKSRKMQSYVETDRKNNNNNDDEFININLKIRKIDLLKEDIRLTTSIHEIKGS